MTDHEHLRWQPRYIRCRAFPLRCAWFGSQPSLSFSIYSPIGHDLKLGVEQALAQMNLFNMPTGHFGTLCLLH